MFYSFPSTSSTKNGHLPNPNYQKTFTTLRYVISTILFQHTTIPITKIGEYYPVQNAPFILTPKQILTFLGQALQSASGFDLLSHLPGFKKPLNHYWRQHSSGFAIVIPEYCKSLFYVVELTVESNLHNNIVRKKNEYKELIRQQKEYFNDVKFINIPLSSRDVFAGVWYILGMLDNFCFDDAHKFIFTSETRPRCTLRRRP